MKRIFLIVLVGMLFLAACSPQAAPVPVTGRPVEATATAAQPTAVPARPSPVSASATAAPVVPAATASPAPVVSTAAAGVVSDDSLNLRLGPGTTYRVARLLMKGQAVRIDGRSSDNRWLVVTLPEGQAGWVSADYITTTAEIAGLPVREAFGGLDGSGVQPAVPTAQPTPSRYSVNVTISDNLAVVSVNRFPANTDLVASLGLPGQGADQQVATGRTDASGRAQLSFSMPETWSDGSPVTQTNLTVIVAAAGGGFSRTAKIVYYH